MKVWYEVYNPYKNSLSEAASWMGFDDLPERRKMLNDYLNEIIQGLENNQLLHEEITPAAFDRICNMLTNHVCKLHEKNC